MANTQTEVSDQMSEVSPTSDLRPLTSVPFTLLFLQASLLMLARLGVGALLVMNGHPWFGLAAMALGCLVDFRLRK